MSNLPTYALHKMSWPEVAEAAETVELWSSSPSAPPSSTARTWAWARTT